MLVWFSVCSTCDFLVGIALDILGSFLKLSSAGVLSVLKLSICDMAGRVKGCNFV